MILSHYPIYGKCENVVGRALYSLLPGNKVEQSLGSMALQKENAISCDKHNVVRITCNNKLTAKSDTVMSV